jgi:hypothetical protein
MDLDIRKSLHVCLLKDTHAALKIKSFTVGLSMQEMFQELADRIVSDDPYMLRLMTELKENKRKKQISKLSSTDTESLFDTINDLNPFENTKED